MMDSDFSYQVITFNGSDVSKQSPRHLSVPLPVILPPLNPRTLETTFFKTRENLTIIIDGNNNILIVNSSDSNNPYSTNKVDCHPTAKALTSGSVVFLCPLVPPRTIELIPWNFDDTPSPKISLGIPYTPTINGTLMMDEENDVLYYLTGIGDDLFVYNLRTQESSLVDTPCNFIGDIKVLDGNNIGLFCANSQADKGTFISVAFRDLIFSDYVNVLLSNISSSDMIVRSLGSVVLLVDETNLYVINRTSGQHVLLNIQQPINDAIVINEMLAFYQTSKLHHFSPLDVLNGEIPYQKHQVSTCGPPQCPFLTKVDKYLVLHSSSASSFEIRDQASLFSQQESDIQPYLYIPYVTKTDDETQTYHHIILPVVGVLALIAFIIALVVTISITVYCRISGGDNTSIQSSDGGNEYNMESRSHYPIQTSDDNHSNGSDSLDIKVIKPPMEESRHPIPATSDSLANGYGTDNLDIKPPHKMN
jgi:hypothetical protein